MNPLKVWQIAFESLPFVKVGGLGDMVYGLSQELKKTEDISVFLPIHQVNTKYLKIEDSYTLSFLGKKIEIQVYQKEMQGIKYHFIADKYYLSRQEVYGYKDDEARYSLFCVALYHYLLHCQHKPDVCHCHDYHTGMFIVLCRYGQKECAKIRQIFTIHNFNFQGQYAKDILKNAFSLPESAYEEGVLRFGEGTNFLKNAIVLADEITTVSQSYREELCQPSEDGLKKLLQERGKHFKGILNGIDQQYFAPNFSSENLVTAKKQAKIRFQKDHNLMVDEKKFVVAMVSRLCFQKGIDFLLRSKIWLDQKVQLWIAGKGENYYEEALRQLSKEYPERFFYVRQADEVFTKKIYEAADLLLMPSLWEPCGLSQMIAMRYATLPLVRATGGLKESVMAYPSLLANGFAFHDCQQASFMACYEDAKKLFFSQRDAYFSLQQNAMHYNSSFTSAANQYRHLYRREYEKV